MKRRWLCGALATAAVLSAGHAAAQPAALSRVAWVSLDKSESGSPTFAAFRAGQGKLGEVEGRRLVLRSWWADGSTARLAQMRGEILAARPDVIVAQGGIALAPMLHASVDRPVVFSMSGDPVLPRMRSIAVIAKTWFGPVYLRKDTEPYMTISRPAGSRGGVTAAEVNLKFVWEVVSRIRIGQAGLAYVIEADGTLIAHPDISLVLKKTSLLALPPAPPAAGPAWPRWR